MGWTVCLTHTSFTFDFAFVSGMMIKTSLLYAKHFVCDMILSFF